jgi:glycine cleavage system H protein
MNVPDDLRYTKEHEWVRVKDDVVEVGITDYAQGELGDIVFVELPKVGDRTTQMEPFGSIEAVKAVSDLYSPLSGEVVEVNQNLEGSPEVINQDPYGEGWMIKIKIDSDSELERLLSAGDYGKLID